MFARQAFSGIRQAGIRLLLAGALASPLAVAAAPLTARADPSQCYDLVYAANNYVQCIDYYQPNQSSPVFQYQNLAQDTGQLDNYWGNFTNQYCQVYVCDYSLADSYFASYDTSLYGLLSGY